MSAVIIGNATLYLGDCTRIISDVAPPGAVVTDPPYGMGFRSNHRHARYDAIANDHTEDHLLWACGLRPRHSSYIFCRWDNIYSVPRPRSVITWVKNNWSMGDLRHSHARQTELVLFYPGPDHFFPKGRPPDVVNAPRSGNKNHPTEKPVSLMQAILSWTDGVVLDPFMGSGSTGVACIQAGRKFIGIETDPGYFSTAVARITEASALTAGVGEGL